jgi:mono/diheme cytochrome c family protein
MGGCWALVAVGATGQEAVSPTVSDTTSAEQGAEGSRSAWDGVYTVEQARRGRTVFRDECGSCHNVEEFQQGYPTAYDLFASRDTMPETAPGALSDQSYADLIAYVFRAADIPAGDVELPGDPEILKRIRIPAGPPEP